MCVDVDIIQAKHLFEYSGFFFTRFYVGKVSEKLISFSSWLMDGYDLILCGFAWAHILYDSYRSNDISSM